MVMWTPAASTSMRLTASLLSLAATGGAVPTICHLSSSAASPLALAAGPLRGDDERRWQHRMGMTLLAARGLNSAKMALADCHLVFLLLI